MGVLKVAVPVKTPRKVRLSVTSAIVANGLGVGAVIVVTVKVVVS